VIRKYLLKTIFRAVQLEIWILEIRLAVTKLQVERFDVAASRKLETFISMR
jgi:hypothetical protein